MKLLQNKVYSDLKIDFYKAFPMHKKVFQLRKSLENGNLLNLDFLLKKLAIAWDT